jgi:hypothetical protein
MMSLISKMAVSIERLENRDSSCCKCCLSANTTPGGVVDTHSDTIKKLKSDDNSRAENADGINEAREAAETRPSPPRKRLSRRNTTADVTAEARARPSSLTRTMSDEKRADLGIALDQTTRAQNAVRSQKRKPLEPPPIAETPRVGAASPQSPPASQTTNAPRKPRSIEPLSESCEPNVTGAPTETRRRLPRAPLRSESLFGARHGDRARNTRRASAVIRKPVSLPHQLRVRSSLPSNLDGLSTAFSRPDAGGDNLLQGPHADLSKRKRRGSRVGIDAFG